ncbi:Cof-type HAD-IIB family hydrolase [Mycoplasmopsis phocirhinis]|uniref:Cof-type HAD-IIB family hydrolase n=1 Tax=Mycoplasmopsis phocirhinis TaxID=142650 RepID=A0A4P6MRX1_9BACT|nr:Cof-type HAD-IIB family hydrolase [Mycoplasmopsis phocirhinis]QBF34819.1 Cof-type HAD-IIB family hydrolase [Mycoplasmopsis phocirhinis]
MNKNIIEGYFIDLDGTMIDKSDETGFLSQTNIMFLLNLQKIKPVIISTGRKPTGAVLKIMSMINSPYAVCSTGSVVVDDKGKILNEILIKNQTKFKLFQFIMSQKLNFIVNGDKSIYHYGNEFNWNKREWVKRFNKTNYSAFDLEQNIRQTLVFGANLNQMAQLQKYINTHFSDLSTHVVSKGYSIEITDKNATKGIANKFVAKLLNIDIMNCAHIGDSRNDLLALPQTGYLVAMGNAEQELKEHAHFVGEEFNDGGLSKTIVKFEQFINQKEIK